MDQGYPVSRPDAYGVFVRRINRFLGLGIVNGEEAYVHIHDPGRLTDILRPGVGFYARAKEGGRARYYLVAVDAGDELVLVDSAMHNRVARWLIENGHLLGGYRVVGMEPRFGGGRFDMLLAAPDGAEALVEVKGVTLERGGVALFPDAPTARGARHMVELARAVEEGYRAFVLFLVLRRNARYLSPNVETDPAFARALKYALDRGVVALAFKMGLCRDWVLRPLGQLDVVLDPPSVGQGTP